MSTSEDYSSEIEWVVEEVSEDEAEVKLNESETIEIFPEVSLSHRASKSNDVALIDLNEEAIISAMFGSGIQGNDEIEKCCNLGCNRAIPKDLAVTHRRTFQELSKHEQDLIILGQLQAFRQVSDLKKVYDKHTRRGKSRSKEQDVITRKSTQFTFATVRICKRMYLFLHDLKDGRFENITKHFDAEGVAPRQHKLKGKSSTRGNELTKADIDVVVTFITSKTEQSDSILHKKSNSKNKKIIKLPTNVTKSSIYRQYCEAFQSTPSMKKVARSTFVTLWKKYCPHIVTIQKPPSDLCDTVRSTMKI